DDRPVGALPRGDAARDVDLRHHPAAEDRAVGVGVRGHRDDAQDGLLVLGEGRRHGAIVNCRRLATVDAAWTPLANARSIAVTSWSARRRGSTCWPFGSGWGCRRTSSP